MNQPHDPVDVGDNAQEDAEASSGGGMADWLRTVLTVGAVLGILAVTGVIVGVIYLTEPEARREGAVKKTAMLVEVTSVEQGTFTPVLTALGTVRADRDVRLQPQVSGQVRALGEGFVPGRIVSAGDLLLRLDPADLRNQLAMRRSELAQAEAALALEKGRQAVARTEREQITGPVSAEQEALILREPQLQSTQARVDAARAAVRQAELDLSRTAVRAPFDALVLSRQVAEGSQVGPGVDLGRLVGTERFWVELTLPTKKLRHLPPRTEGTSVRLRDRTGWEEGVYREGRLQSVVRQVDAQTRMARVLVAVDDPLALQAEGPALVAGAFVEARIDGAVLQDVVRLPRVLVRKGDTVWEMAEGKLRIREVEVILEDADHAYLASGLQPDARVVTTDLATVTDGAPLRLEGEGR